MIVDACKPFERLAAYPRTSALSQAEVTAIKAAWGEAIA
jgi:hypothetical protein